MLRRAFLSSLGSSAAIGAVPGSVEAQPVAGKLRIWKLGDIEARIYPTQEAIHKLGKLLSQWDGKSDLDLIWGPEIQMEMHDLGDNTIDIVVPVDAEIRKRPAWAADLEVGNQIRPRIRITEKRS